MAELYVNRLLKLFKNNINWDHLVPTCLAIAQELENADKLTGKQKLKALQDVLRLALLDAPLPAEKKEEILHQIDTTVPVVMEAAKMASKNPIVNQAVSTCLLCITKRG